MWRMIARQPGGPDAIEREDFMLDEPADGQVRLRHEAIGVNYIDTYHRSGLYPLPLPITLGSEMAGVIEAVGPGVTEFSVGQRVSALPGNRGGYATHSLVSTRALIALPDDISFDTAAAAMLKGLTAWMLIEPCARIQSGDAVLVHAAAGGVGAIVVQWLKAVGATVIAHAGSDAKAAKAKALGADHALSCPFDQLAGEVRALTGGRGVTASLDGVGAASWGASLASLARRGLLATYGNASGAVPPFAPLELARAGSLFVTRPTVFDYIETPARMAEGSGRVFAMLRDGKVTVEIGQRFALADAADAHRALESRSTTGSTVLTP